MIRLTRCHRANHAGQYFRRHLLTGDSPERPVLAPPYHRAHWLGDGLGLIGLHPDGLPRAEALVRLCSGLHPTLRQRLAPAVNRTRAYYDLTVAAPKSVSLAALLLPEHPVAQRVMGAHVNAVRVLARDLGRLIRPQGLRCRHQPGRWVGAIFTHTHTREGDPHLHNHLILPNVMQNAEGQWRAMQVLIAGDARRELGLRYGHELARGLRLAGLGDSLSMRENGLPEVAPLRPLTRHFSQARLALLRAERAREVVEAAEREEREGAERRRKVAAPRAGAERSRPPLPDSARERMRRRQRLADRLRRVKPKEADQPTGLEGESARWREGLEKGSLLGLIRLLDRAKGRPGVVFQPGPPPPPVRLLTVLPPEVSRLVRAVGDRLALEQPTLGRTLLRRESLRASMGRHHFEHVVAAADRIIAANERTWARMQAEEGLMFPQIVAAWETLPKTVRVASSPPPLLPPLAPGTPELPPVAPTVPTTAAEPDAVPTPGVAGGRGTGRRGR